MCNVNKIYIIAVKPVLCLLASGSRYIYIVYTYKYIDIDVKFRHKCIFRPKYIYYSLYRLYMTYIFYESLETKPPDLTNTQTQTFARRPNPTPFSIANRSVAAQIRKLDG